MDKTIATRFGPVHARIEGSGPPIVLLHGYYPDNSWQVWEHNLGAFAQAGYTVYALDLLGYGQSGSERLDHRQQAQAIADVMDGEGLKTAILGGVSWGGMIALELALSAPERVGGLLLVDSAGAGYYTKETLGLLSCPVLVVWGEDDSIIPVANAAWFAAAIPNCRVETVADVTQQEGAPAWAGHMPMRFRPAEFNRIVTEFLTHPALPSQP